MNILNLLQIILVNMQFMVKKYLNNLNLMKK